MDSGWYWVRHPGGKWQPGDVTVWPPAPMFDIEGETTVQLFDDITLYPAAEMEIGPEIEMPAELA